MAVVRKNISFKYWILIPYDFPSEGKNAGVGLGGFGIGDVAEADVDLGEGGPGEQVVGLERGGLEGGPQGFLEIVGFQESHGKRMPGIEMGGIEFHTFSVEGGGFREFTEGEVAAGVVEGVLEFLAQNFKL
jgi:hypothetical protein